MSYDSEKKTIDNKIKKVYSMTHPKVIKTIKRTVS